MPPKTATDGAAKDNSSKTFSFDDVAYLVAKLDAAKIGLGNKDYQIMAKLNGTRSEHGYQHLFRAVKARGREIVPMINDGDVSAIKGSPAKSPAAGKAKAGGNGEKKGAKRGKLSSPGVIFEYPLTMTQAARHAPRRTKRMARREESTRRPSLRMPMGMEMRMRMRRWAILTSTELVRRER